jgi:hypothetical protein
MSGSGHSPVRKWILVQEACADFLRREGIPHSIVDAREAADSRHPAAMAGRFGRDQPASEMTIPRLIGWPVGKA